MTAQPSSFVWPMISGSPAQRDALRRSEVAMQKASAKDKPPFGLDLSCHSWRTRSAAGSSRKCANSAQVSRTIVKQTPGSALLALALLAPGGNQIVVPRPGTPAQLRPEIRQTQRGSTLRRDRTRHPSAPGLTRVPAFGWTGPRRRRTRSPVASPR